MKEAVRPTRKLFKELCVTADAIRSVPWEQAIDDNDREDIEYYCGRLFSAATKANEAGDARTEEVYVLLGSIASLCYDDKDPTQPYRPMMESATGRSAALVDFTEQHLAPLTEVYVEIEDNEMRGRIADILWLLRKDHRAAKVAVQAYLAKCRSAFSAGHWVTLRHRLTRAMHIAASLGKSSSERRGVAMYAKTLLSSVDVNTTKYLTSWIIRLLLDTKAALPVELAQYADKAASAAESRGDWMTAADYWALVSVCYTKAGDEYRAREAMRTQGYAQVAVGEAMAKSEQPGLASDWWLEQGFHTLRQAQTSKAELASLQQRLHTFQAARNARMNLIKTETPLDPELLTYLDRVKGRSFRDSLIFLAMLAKPRTKEQLKQDVLAKQQTSVVASLFQTIIVREDGKTDSVLPPLPLDGEPTEEVLNGHMWHRGSIVRTLSAWMAEYVRRIIAGEHAILEESLEWLLNENSLVPPGHIEIYDRALRAGLEGDYLVAAHMFPPQLENSIRHALCQSGVVTTFMGLDRTQDEFPINKLVSLPEFEQLFGADLAFELRGLLAERPGGNVRNNVGHGLWRAEYFRGPNSVILLPLTIWLLLHGLHSEVAAQDASSADEKDQSTTR